MSTSESVVSGTESEADLYSEFRRWRLTVDNSWESFLEWRELKRKAEQFDSGSGSSRITEEAVPERQASNRWAE